MEETEIRTLLSKIVNETFDYHLPVTDDLSAEKIDNWTSFTHTLFIVEIETCFSITLSLREVGRFKNLGDIVAAIKIHKNPNLQPS